MNKVLKEYLVNGRLYLNIDRCLNLHLGVADKAGLIACLRETDHPGWRDLWHHTCNYLWDMGYRSKQFEDIYKQTKKMEKFWYKNASIRNAHLY